MKPAAILLQLMWSKLNAQMSGEANQFTATVEVEQLRFSSSVCTLLG
ncbi:hypothetical protein C3B55_00224 [Candidatus Pseudomonas adelgestsugas]|uniref:Uncharacterized protein n=1 Tax=Candidatus Pseudomonas adelgestsugas TaxID=1302376 RepID=A0ABX5R7G3_9PSED|nr:hypothetical protein C3B55_00224 [Candidatus Pseudomonas adelgestsugas]